MTERNIAAEVLDGLREVREHRAGKRTLKTVRVEPRPLPKLTPEIIRSARDRLGVSRAVFAHIIRVPIRTVERWEQGRLSPPESAAALILMAQKYPDTFDRLASLEPSRLRTRHERRRQQRRPDNCLRRSHGPGAPSDAAVGERWRRWRERGPR